MYLFFRRNRVRRSFMAVVMLILWLTICILFGKKFMDGNEKSALELKNSTVAVGHPNTFNFYAELHTFSPLTQQAKLEVVVTHRSEARRRDKFSMALGQLNTTNELTKAFGQVLALPPLNFRDIFLYPFDKYKATFDLEFCFLSQTRDRPEFHFVPKTSSQEFILKLSSEVFPGAGPKEKSKCIGKLKPEVSSSTPPFETYDFADKTTLIITLERQPFTFVISIFILVLMWLLALAMLNIAVDSLVYGRVLPAEFITAAFALVFSFPSLREAQPSIPDMGCMIDFVGYFWSLSVISFSSCILLFLLAYRWKPDCHRVPPRDILRASTEMSTSMRLSLPPV